MADTAHTITAARPVAAPPRSRDRRARRQPQRGQVRRLQRADRHVRRRQQLPRHHRRADSRSDGRARDVVDTPGVYGVSSFNDEETVARDIILEGDVVINVVDAVHLERDLFLTLQLIDMGKPLVVALNMADEARKRGVGVDRDLLEDLLGVPVIETVAVTGAGLDDLGASLERARTGHADPDLERDLVLMASRVGTRAEALMVLEGDEVISQRHGLEPGVQRDAIYMRRRHRVNDICGHVVSETTQGPPSRRSSRTR